MVGLVTFLALLVASSVRAAPGVLITPLEREFGWDRATISAAIAVSILTFGLSGPISGTLVNRFGPRKVILFGCVAIAASLAAFTQVRSVWQLFLFLVIGAFGAARSTGQLLFIPAMAGLADSSGWRSAILLLMGACLVVVIPVAIFMRDRPEDMCARAFGEQLVVSDADQAADKRSTPMRVASGRPTSGCSREASSSAATPRTGSSARTSSPTPSSTASLP